MKTKRLLSLVIVVAAVGVQLAQAADRSDGAADRQNTFAMGRRPGAASVPENVLAPAAARNFGTMDFPRASDSAAFGINDNGVVVGGYGADLESQYCNHGFVLHGNVFSIASFPAASQTCVSGINKAGEMVGYYLDAGGNTHGFTRTGSTYTSVDFPGATVTTAGGINSSGSVVGAYRDTGGVYHGFLLASQTYTTIDAPGASGGLTEAAGINKAGEIVGVYVDSAGHYHGFALANGAYTTVDYPGAVDSDLLGLNDKGDMVGAYGDGTGPFAIYNHGFLVNQGQFTGIDVPFVGALVTWVNAINNSRVIVGFYIDTAGRYYGYTAKVGP